MRRQASSRWRNRTLAEVLLFTGASAAASLLSGLGQAILARELTVGAFGAYAFAFSCLQLGALFFEFGLFLPVSRLLAAAHPLRQRELVGSGLALYCVVGLMFVAAVFGFSQVADSIFKVQAGDALSVTAPLAFAYPFGVVALQLTQGAGRLHVYSLGNLAGQTLFVACLAALAALGLGRTTATGLTVRGLTLGLGWLAVVIWLRPRLKQPLEDIRAFAHQARRYGFQVYVGRVLSIGTYNMDILMLGAFTTPQAVALYALAGAITGVIGLPTAGFASAVFPRMVAAGEMRRAWLVGAWAIGIGGAAAAWLLASQFIAVVFTNAYVGASAYILPLALAQAVRGVTTIYNGFLAAQAGGRELRNAGVVLTVSNLVLNVALIPAYGAAGAAWASLAALIANLGAHIVGYRRIRRRGIIASARAPEPTGSARMSVRGTDPMSAVDDELPAEVK